MCGEIFAWQVARSATVRLTTTGAQTHIVLNNKFDRVEEIRLDEIQITGFNGGVSGGAYLHVTCAGLNDSSANNEAKPGVLVAVDVLNPHVYYSRPVVLGTGQLFSVNNFDVSLTLPNGTAVTFTEAVFRITFVCRRSLDEMQQFREMKAAMETPPSIKDGMARNNWNPTIKFK